LISQNLYTLFITWKGFFFLSFFTSPFTFHPLFWNNLSCEDDIGDGRPIDL
jgi:hypothetical protein